MLHLDVQSGHVLCVAVLFRKDLLVEVVGSRDVLYDRAGHIVVYWAVAQAMTTEDIVGATIVVLQCRCRERELESMQNHPPVSFLEQMHDCGVLIQAKHGDH
eukprot:scpid79124/ scgid7172/ 